VATSQLWKNRNCSLKTFAFGSGGSVPNVFQAMHGFLRLVRAIESDAKRFSVLLIGYRGT